MKITDKQLWDLCQKYGAEARKWKRKFAALLPEVERRQLWEKHGFYSIYHFAKIVGGVGESTVKLILSTHRRVEDKPRLKAEIEKQGVHKVAVVASLPLEEDELVEMVQTLPKSSLAQYRKDMKQQESQKIAGYSPKPDSTLKIDKSIEFRLKKIRQKLEKEQKRAITLKETLNILLDQVEEKPKKTRKAKPVKAGSRHISVKTRRKFSDKCAMCNNPAEEIHHPDRFAASGNHNRLVPLCHEHHQLAHAGLIENEQGPPEKWRFRKQMQPDSIDRKYLKQLSLIRE